MSEIRAGHFSDLLSDEPYPGVARRTLDGVGATVARYEFEPGASFPLHRHPQEQITLVLKGSVLMTLGELEQELDAGSWSVVPGQVEHAIQAGLEGALIAAVLAPRRLGAHPYEVVDR